MTDAGKAAIRDLILALSREAHKASEAAPGHHVIASVMGWCFAHMAQAGDDGQDGLYEMARVYAEGMAEKTERLH